MTDLLPLVQETVALKRIGREYRGLCPWHADSTPSLYINPEKHVWLCRACNAGGTAVSWVMRLHDCTAAEAHRRLGHERPPGSPSTGGRERRSQAAAERRRYQTAQGRLDVIATELKHALPIATRRSDMEGRAWDKVTSLYHRRDSLRAWWAQNIPGPQDWPD